MILAEKKTVFNAGKDCAFPDHRGRGGEEVCCHCGDLK